MSQPTLAFHLGNIQAVVANVRVRPCAIRSPLFHRLVCFSTDNYIYINNFTFTKNYTFTKNFILTDNYIFIDNYTCTNQRVDCWANDALKPEKTMPEKIKPDKGHQQP